MTNEIEVYEGGIPAFEAGDDEDFQALIAENMGDADLQRRDLPQVKFPGGGATTWEVEDVSAAKGIRPESELIGVVLGQQVTRTFFAVDIDDRTDDTPDQPDCAANDGLTGIVRDDRVYSYNEAGFAIGGLEFEGAGDEPDRVLFGGDCMKCPLNEFGSDLNGGKGKACREFIEVAFLEVDQMFPSRLRVPPTSLGPWRAFAAKLTLSRVSFSNAVIGLSLESEGTYATIVPRLVGLVPREMRPAARDLVTLSRSLLAPRPPEPPQLAAGSESPLVQAAIDEGAELAPPLTDDDGPF